MDALKALLLSVFFVPSSTQYNTFEKRFDADGKVFMWARAHDDLTAKTPYKIIVNEYGPVTAALADDTTYYYVGVPLAAIASGADGLLQIGGYIAGMICASDNYDTGDGIIIVDGGLASTDADYTGAAGQFAVCAQADEDAATDIDAMLVPERILSTT
jgi:hypothetical protein